LDRADLCGGAVLQLIVTTTFSGADFSIQHDGVCRMNPELARRVAQAAILADCSWERHRNLSHAWSISHYSGR
jgi:hypothetical protein